MNYKVKRKQLLINIISLVLIMCFIYKILFRIEAVRIWHYKYTLDMFLFDDVFYIMLLIIFVNAAKIYSLKARDGKYIYHPRFGTKKIFEISEIGKIVAYKGYWEIMDRNDRPIARLDVKMKGFEEFKEDMNSNGIKVIDGKKKTRYGIFLKLRIVWYIFVIFFTYLYCEVTFNPNSNSDLRYHNERKYDGYYLYDDEMYYVMGENCIHKYVGGGDYTNIVSDDGYNMLDGGWEPINDYHLAERISWNREEYYLGHVWDGTVDEEYYPFEQDVRFWYYRAFDYSYYDKSK